jgi:protein-disulfide isomerase
MRCRVIPSARITAGLLTFLAASAGGAFASRHDVVEGNPASPVRVLIYEDLQSGRGAQFQQMLQDKLLPRYGSRVAFVHRDFVLARHDWAGQAAIAARWAWEQSNVLGIQIRREILAEHESITARNLKDWLIDFAYRNHLDPKGIVDSLADKRLGALVDQDQQAAMARGVTQAPTIYVGGISFAQDIIYDDLVRVLDDALGK